MNEAENRWTDASVAISGNALRQAARDFLRAHHTLTLATTRDNLPWAAAVYYVFRGKKIYFFSNPDSRHIQDACRTGKAAAVISSDNQEWQTIQGVQMSGSIYEVTAGIEAAGAIQRYLRAFPFVKSFFKGTEKLNLTALMNRFKARLYCFEPECVYYLDNHIAFGFRKKVFL